MSFISSLSSHAAQFFSNQQQQQQESTIIMPAVQDWRTTPWAVADAVLAQHFKQDNMQVDPAWEKRVKDLFRSNLSGGAGQWERELPSLNETPQHQLVDGQVVRFRCMVQDMFDPEFYVAVVTVRDLTTGKVWLLSCL